PSTIPAPEIVNRMPCTVSVSSLFSQTSRKFVKLKTGSATDFGLVIGEPLLKALRNVVSSVQLESGPGPMNASLAGDTEIESPSDSSLLEQPETNDMARKSQTKIRRHAANERPSVAIDEFTGCSPFVRTFRS